MRTAPRTATRAPPIRTRFFGATHSSINDLLLLPTLIICKYTDPLQGAHRLKYRKAGLLDLRPNCCICTQENTGTLT